MKRTLIAGLFSLVLTRSLSAQPLVRAALNAASYAVNTNGLNEIAQGSMFVIFGSGMGPATLAQVNAFPLPASQGLQGTSVQVISGGATIDCIMIYTVALQVAAVLPSRTPLGDARLVVRYNGVASTPLLIRVVQRAFGTFAVNQKGTGPGVIQNVLSETNRPVNGPFKAARPGAVLILWGTGLGPVQGDEAAGALPGDLAAVPLEIFVGGRAARFIYRGRSGCCAGIDQIVFEIPMGVSGCFVPVIVKIGNTVSNQTTMAVGDTDTCSENGRPITSAPPITGIVNYSCIGLNRVCTSLNLPTQVQIPGLENCLEGLNSETLNAAFGRSNLDQLDLSAYYATRMAGSCSVVTLVGDVQNTQEPTLPTSLDAGTITLTGPRGVHTVSRLADGRYDGGLPKDFLAPGNYIVEGSGGIGPDSIGPFRVTTTLSAALVWTNRGGISTINRAAGQEVTWSGCDPNGRVSISGFGFAGDERNALITMFFCSERTSARRFVIPPYVLLAVPAASPDLPFNGFLRVGDEGEVKYFAAPRLDTGALSWRYVDGKAVKYQ